MSEGINIDFGLLKPPPDPVTSYANAFHVGQGLAKAAAATGNAARAGAPDPEPARTWAGSLSADQRVAIGQRAEIVGALGQGLASLPYDARGGVLAHLAPALIARGVPADALAAFDPTDAALARVAGATQAVRGWLGG